MNIFYLFAGLLMLVCVCGAIGSAVILLVGFLTKNRVRKTSLSLGGFGLCASLLALGLVAGCNHLLWGPTTDPAAVYQHAFNSPPPPAATNLQAIAYYGADSAARYLQFTTDEATFRSILPKGLSRDDTKGYLSSEPPKWWTPAVPGQTEFYYQSRDPDDPGRPPGAPMSERTLMTWNPKTGVAQLHWEAID